MKLHFQFEHYKIDPEMHVLRVSDSRSVDKSTTIFVQNETLQTLEIKITNIHGPDDVSFRPFIDFSSSINLMLIGKY